MNLEFAPVKVAARENGPGMLVYADGWLVAVLVELSDIHKARAGCLFLESGFGYFSECEQPVFLDVLEAEEWFKSQLVDIVRYDPARLHRRRLGAPARGRNRLQRAPA